MPKKILYSAAFFYIIFSASQCFPQEAKELPPPEAIRQYREALKTETNPQAIAETHYKIGYALEQLGRETEATAEYLKIIINYPQIESINKKAEERLAYLYSDFSERSKNYATRYKTTEEQKDPTIFFAYIKSLYENYKNLGQYDRAIHVLQKLYDIDPENSSYLIDMGEIYLQGYNDADKAIFHFKKALEVMPNNPKVYLELGMSYEKKEDYESAVRAYTRSVEISPASPWAMYSLRRIESIRLLRDKRLVKDWYFLGPFDNADGKGLETQFPPEKKIELGSVYTGKDEVQVKWLRPFNYDSSGYVDLNMLFSPNDYAIAYALTYVYSPDNREVCFKLGAEDGIRVWLDEKEVFNNDISLSAGVDDYLVAVNLDKGWNKILVKISDTWGGWGFYFRVTDPKGNPLEDLIFDPLKDETRVRLIYNELRKERRFRITQIAAIYSIAISVLLLGLYFMISNIHGRIRINRMKEDFISSVSHELKTPIAAIKMLTETLKMGKVRQSTGKEQYYDMIIRESDRLTRFINKILDFSKIEKGENVFYFEKTNVVDLAKNAVEIFKSEAQDESLNLRFNAEKDQLFVDADKDAILQVIFNLLDNAYKYSKEEKDISVTVKQADSDIQIEVTDKGVGMPKNEIERIFDKFYRIDRDIMKGIKGSGLGLAFVKSVINGHNGRIAVGSEIGKGSKFVISLPVHM